MRLSKVRNPGRFRLPRWAALAVILVLAFGGGLGAVLPSQNGAGVSLTQSSGENWSGTEQTNSAGGVLEIAGAFDGSRDVVNPAGATAYLGHLDPGELNPSGARAAWQLYR